MRAPADASRGRGVALAAVGALAVSGCGGAAGAPREGAALPRGSESVTLDPADFTVDITNRYWPMRPGDQWISSETDGKGDVLQVEVTVEDATYTVAAGIEARVVHDVVSRDGAVVEDTLDWYAQDADGNLWYLGERTAEYENGRVTSTEGSWEAGVDGAQPGIAVPADPRHVELQLDQVGLQRGGVPRQECPGVDPGRDAHLLGRRQHGALVLRLPGQVFLAVGLSRAGIGGDGDARLRPVDAGLPRACLLYTSPSPRD